jgi:hypothetical protein
MFLLLVRKLVIENTEGSGVMEHQANEIEVNNFERCKEEAR